MAGADLDRVVDMLRSERMEAQFRLLGGGTLLAELRSEVSVVHSSSTLSKGTNLRLMFCIQSLVAPLGELLDAVLHTRMRAEQWHQVLFGRRFSRAATLRDLRQFLGKFRSLASHVSQMQNHVSMHHDSSRYNNVTFPASRMDALGHTMVGRSELLEKLVSILVEDRTRYDGLLVMPIVGGPGVGKTRLARALLCDSRVQRKFCVRLVVPVTRNFSLERVLLLLISPERRAEILIPPQAMATLIGHKLSGAGGDYLILLDDLWSDKQGKWLEMRTLMKALPWNGRIVVTTRTPDVASELASLAQADYYTNKPLFLQPLGQEFSSLFVDEWLTAYCGDWPAEFIREAGTTIAHKCGGVPLLLQYARSCFCQPQGVKFWQGFLDQHTDTDEKVHPYAFWFWPKLLARLNDLPHDMFWQRLLGHSNELPDGNAVLESAAVSYQHLPSDMRGCLLYCSMFPSNYDIEIEELADLLAAEGYIPAVVTKAQQKGFLQQLLDECFYALQEHESGDRYRMHKVMHIFAQNMAGKTSSIFRVDHATKVPTKGVRRASLVVNPLTTSFPTSLFECQDLGALILLQEGPMCPPDQPQCEITEIPPAFFQSFKRIQALGFRDTKIRILPTKFLHPHLVKYLNLSQTDIENIPSSISRLLNLQTLILSHCDSLQKLHPSITRLAQLQKLDLEGCCSLVELPHGLKKMNRLEYLNATYCSSLTHMPRGMGELKSLQTLLGYMVSYIDGSSMSELLPLANLHKLCLQSLEKVSDLLDVRNARLDYKINLKSLSLRWNVDGPNSTTLAYAVLESLQPPRHLKYLEIVAYEGEMLPSWMTVTQPYLASLVEIRLINLRSCEKVLPPLGLLPCLKIAEISGAETVRCIRDNFYGQKGTFPSLEKLVFSYMHNLEVWEQEHRPGMFPRLTELAIIQCPKLRALHMELPSVEKLIFWMNNEVLCVSKGALRGVANSLKHMQISFGEHLHASSECEGLQDLGKLTKLEICGCSDLTCLPWGLQNLSTIRSLTIDNCRKLETLPNWLENLPSLQTICLSGCPLLRYIPGGLQQRPDVTVYIEDCPNLPEQTISNFPAQSSGMLNIDCILHELC
jgi:Leucine-rich repeat (LRR) protein